MQQDNDALKPNALFWPADLFHYDKREAEKRAKPSKLDVGGRGRSLVSGPNRKIQPGLWRLTVTVAVDEWAARHRYTIAWGPETAKEVYEFSPGKEGVFEVDIEARWDRAEKAKMRIKLVDASLGGSFEFLSAQAKMLDG